MLATSHRRMADKPSRPLGETQKQQFNMRLSSHARNLLARMALARGVSQTAIMEMLIRDGAETMGIVKRDT